MKTLSGFKSGIKKWWPQNCPCKVCKRNQPNIGFYNLGPFHAWC